MESDEALPSDIGIEVAIAYAPKTNINREEFSTDDEFREALAARFLVSGSFVKAFEVYTNMLAVDEFPPGREEPYRVGPIVGLVAYVQERLYEGRLDYKSPPIEKLKAFLAKGLASCQCEGTLLWTQIAHALHVGNKEGEIAEDSVRKRVPKPGMFTVKTKEQYL